MDPYNKIYNLPLQLEKARARYLLYIKQAREYAMPEILNERDLVNEAITDERASVLEAA